MKKYDIYHMPYLMTQDLTILPSKKHLRWQQTRKLFAYRESTHTIISVTFPYFMCTLPQLDTLSILFVNILTLLACTHSSDNLFHTLMVLCENENFLTSNLLCFFTRVKLCPLVILLSSISKEMLESIFYNH